MRIFNLSPFQKGPLNPLTLSLCQFWEFLSRNLLDSYFVPHQVFLDYLSLNLRTNFYVGLIERPKHSPGRDPLRRLNVETKPFYEFNLFKYSFLKCPNVFHPQAYWNWCGFLLTKNPSKKNANEFCTLMSFFREKERNQSESCGE